MEHTYAVIMAGGVGSRFWPTSTESTPKQFLDILGTGETLLQQTYRRLKNVCAADRIYVVTHANYVAKTLEQLPELTIDQILAEPVRRNTAPCIAYAAFKLKKRDPLANFVVTPADHLITDEVEFSRVVKVALETTKQHNVLLTLGMQPHRPETGYGYIQFKDQSTELHPEIRRVKSFTEKPNTELAASFLASGEFLWNSGLFVWNANAILSAFEKHLPELYSTFNQGWDVLNTSDEAAFIAENYPACPNESVDYGILEKCKNVYVLPANFGWSDLGSWGAIHEQQMPDSDGNTGVETHVLTFDCKNNTVSIPKNTVAVLDGLEDFIVILAENRLLICRRAKEQDIKSFVNEVKLRLGNQFV